MFFDSTNYYELYEIPVLRDNFECAMIVTGNSSKNQSALFSVLFTLNESKISSKIIKFDKIGSYSKNEHSYHYLQHAQ